MEDMYENSTKKKTVGYIPKIHKKKIPWTRIRATFKRNQVEKI